MIDIYSDGATVGKNGKFGTVKAVGLGIYIPKLNIKKALHVEGLSNNEAEFKALIIAMETAILKGITRARFHSDSKTILNRANGHKPKGKFANSRMDKFQDRVLELKQDFEIALFKWIPREQNEEADELSNLAKKQKKVWAL